MGMNVVPLKDLTPDKPTMKALDLLKNMDPNDAQNQKSRGQLDLELTYKPFKEDEEVPAEVDEDSSAKINMVQKSGEGTLSGGGLLVVTIHEAQDLEGKHHTNPYAKILFRGEQRKTKVTLSISI